ncbi:MAG: inositol monophosphatase family protein [Dehalococcoidia bacterium]
MDKSFTKKLKNVLLEASNAASEFVINNFEGDFDVFNKGIIEGENLVTSIDKKSQEIVYEVMIKNFPDHVLLGEEESDYNEKKTKDWMWIVDPIDGTTNYVNKLSIFAISIAILFKGTPVASSITIPSIKNKKTIMYAIKDQGTWINNKKININHSFDVPKKGILSVTPKWLKNKFTLSDKLIGNLGEIRNIGSTCYELFLVANNQMQYAISGYAHTWDFAAGILLIKEAGGSVMKYSEKENKFINFEGWSKGYLNDEETYSSMQNWKGLILSGNKKIVNHISNNIKK